MELRQLEHFVAVVDHGSIKKASDVVHISQPGLSMSIKRLEEHLGAVLLVRMARGVAPTAAGQQLYRHAKVALRRLSLAAFEVHETAERQPLALGVAALFRVGLVFRAIGEAQRRVPTRLELHSAVFHTELVDRVREGSLDLALVRLPEEPIAGLRYVPLYERSISIYCGSDHLLAGAASLDDLLAASWVTLAGLPDEFSSRFEQAFRMAGVSAPMARMEVDTLELLRCAVVHGGYVGVMPDSVAHDALAQHQVVKLLAGAVPAVPAGIVHREEDADLTALATLVDVLREAHAGGPALRP